MALHQCKPGRSLPRSRSLPVCTPLCAFKAASRNSKASGRLTRVNNKSSVKPSPSKSEAAASKDQYLALAGFSALAGTALTTAPQTFWELLGSNDIVAATLTSSEVYGAYWVLVATAAYRLSQAAEDGNLSSPTYQRLNAFLALFSTASALPFIQGAVNGQLSPAPAAAAAAVLIASAISTYIPVYLRSGGSTDLSELAAGCASALKSTFKAGRGWTGAFYSLIFWESLILGIALVGGPILPTVAEDITGTTLLSKDLVGIGTLLYAGLIWLLLDADDRGRSGASTFRALNGACALVALVVGVACVAGQANGLSTNLTNQVVMLVSCVLTAKVFGFQSTRPFKDSK